MAQEPHQQPNRQSQDENGAYVLTHRGRGGRLGNREILMGQPDKV
jgi:hypothetical protein